ncbi:MAG TPA: caspase family protein [Bacteroidales bacterium]|nr:caspase family protein [Bacteroidales bacterium]
MMKTYTLLSLTMFFLAASLNVSSQTPKKFYKVGQEFMENNKYSDAVDQFTKSIEGDPDYEDAYEGRATAYEHLSEYKKAQDDYEKLTIFDPKEESFFYKGAEMSFKLKNYPSALVRLANALEIKRFYPEAMQLRVLTLIEMKRYNEALEQSKDALRYKETDVNYFNHGRINELLGVTAQAKEAYENALKKNKNFLEAYVALADLQRKERNLDPALETINKALAINKNYVAAYRVRSAVYADQLKYAEAINDISTILLMQPNNADMYFLRGKYYQGYAQHMNAVTDFSKVISLQPQNASAFYNRAFSYEQIMKFDEAIKDYKKLAEVAENDDEALELMEKAENRLFELNRENEKPEVVLVNPAENGEHTLNVPTGKDVIPIVGNARDESSLKEVRINGMKIPFTRKKAIFEFMTSVNLAENKDLTVDVSDVYGNTTTVNYSIVRTEIDPPRIHIRAPYASDNNVIYLDSDDPSIYVEGSINDASLIKAIYINDVIASYVPDEKNPNFQAMINIQNRNKFTVKAEDYFGNISEITYRLNREAVNLGAENPMGKTWVVFIENSNYQNFASLEGPDKDITLMKTALAKYSIHNFIHKQNMTKNEMERFFAIELRDLLRSNRVNSILVWYAGHGKFVNKTGYWVPVDAKRDDEFTYFNINQLKASMQSYPNTITHNLIITDACESGPSFYQAMRSELPDRSCNDWASVRLKSSQVFSSAGYELAVDNSQFTRTFANVLANNPDACLPIESVVKKVTNAVEESQQQKPQFGKIDGLEDENGTFFFIAK